MEDRRELRICDEMSNKIIRVAEEMVVTSGAHTITVRKILTALEIGRAHV